VTYPCRSFSLRTSSVRVNRTRRHDKNGGVRTPHPATWAALDNDAFISRITYPLEPRRATPG
jgi:hypothetical protein